MDGTADDREKQAGMRSLLFLWGIVTGALEGLFAAGSYAIDGPLLKLGVWVLVCAAYGAAGLTAGTLLQWMSERLAHRGRQRRISEEAAATLWGALYLYAVVLGIVHLVLRPFEHLLRAGIMPVLAVLVMALPAWGITCGLSVLRSRLDRLLGGERAWARVTAAWLVGITALCVLLLLTPGRLALAQRTTVSGNLLIRLANRWTLPRVLERLPEGQAYQEQVRAKSAIKNNPWQPLPFQPDIFLITVDTLRADHLASYGYHTVTSPALDQLARSSIVFEQAIVQRPTTAPSLATLLTGQYPWRHGLRRIGDALPEDARTLPELLEAEGYYCKAVVRNPMLSAVFGFAQGFAEYDSVLSEGNVGDREAVDKALDWLDGGGGERLTSRPVFFWIHLFAPHFPYDETEKDLERRSSGFSLVPLRSLAYPLWKNNTGFIGFNLNRYLELYDGEIQYVDSQIDRLLTKLEELGALERSIVIFTSDHGESFGEMDYFSHGFTISDAEMRVPLFIRIPGNRWQGLRVPSVVQIADLAPTILELAGVEVKDSTFDGQSLTPLIQLVRSGLPAPPGVAYSETGLVGKLPKAPRIAMRTGPWLYGYDATLGTREKYLLGDRASEQVWDNAFDAAQDPDREAMISMRSYLRDFHRSSTAPSAPSVPEKIRERLRSLGYMN